MQQASDIDFLGHLARESSRFGQVMAATAADAAVPACPGWNADDLLWHLAEVQRFWGQVVAQGVLANAEAAELDTGLRAAARPAGRADLLQFYATVSDQLGEVLAASPPGTPAWTWAQDHTVGFIRRRQAHEALIHRIDAELTAGTRTAMDPQLSADGVDEALRVMYGGDVPGWGRFEPDPERTLRIRATDTAGSWLVTLGHFSGTDPDDGKSYDQPAIHVADNDPGTEAAAAIEGGAADLDCWLWHRPATAALGRSGSSAVLADFDSSIADGIS